MPSKLKVVEVSSVNPKANIAKSSADVRAKELDEKVLYYSLDHSQAMRGFSHGEFDLQNAKALAEMYYPVSAAFPLFIAGALTHMRDEKSRILLVENLYEEHGNLDPAKTHPALFRKYIHALGLSPNKLEIAESGTFSETVVSTYMHWCVRGPEHCSLAILYAFEKLFSPICSMIVHGFKKNPLLPKGSLVFFDVHAKADVGHARDLRTALFTSIKSERQWEEALKTADQGAHLLFRLFDAIAQVKREEILLAA